MKKSNLISTKDTEELTCFQKSLLSQNQMMHILGGGVQTGTATKENDNENSEEDDNDHDDGEQLGVPVLIPF